MIESLLLRHCFAVAICLLGLPAFAQLADKLPAMPDYLGEIRRGPDGSLRAVPEDARSRPVPRAATLRVGLGEDVRSIGEAARLAKDGDVVEIRAGAYRGQPAVWTQNDLIIRGVGDTRPVMIADGKSAEGKAIWVIRGGKVTVENIEFRGAQVPDHNGAGIRLEKGSLTVRSCAFIANETGILTANQPEISLEVSGSEFADTPRTREAFHHQLYVGAIGKFVLRGSRFHNGFNGHLVKSRARESHVLYNLLVDGGDGQASYELEFPNGGIAYVIGNAIGQGPRTENPVMVAYGAEGPRWPDNALYLAHNTLINDAPGGSFVKIFTDKLGGPPEVWLLNNLLVGKGDFFRPAVGRFDGNRTAERGELIAFAGTPLRLTNGSPLRGAVRPAGEARGVSLLPDAEFVLPAGTRRASPPSALSPGAFQ